MHIFFRRTVRMNKADLISKIAVNSGLSKKDSEKALAATIDAIVDSLKEGEKVQLVGFGIFDVKERAARTGRNPKTKEAIKIPASRTPQFKAGKALKDAVAK
ncbi:MAG: HU family DNA-binding protein [Clostridiales bacterium]|nr:HU family DNA-binding protein [Clostridiales bacterium]